MTDNENTEKAVPDTGGEPTAPAPESADAGSAPETPTEPTKSVPTSTEPTKQVPVSTTGPVDFPDAADIPDSAPETQQFGVSGTDRSPRAYSQVDADTSGVGIPVPPGGERPATAQFEQVDTTGTIPAAGDGFGPVPTGPQPAARRGAPMSSGRLGRTAKIAIISVLSVLLVAIIAAVGSELYFRNNATDCLESTVEKQTGFPVSASLSRKPMVLQWANGVPYVQVDGKGDNGDAINARLDRVSLGSDTTIGKLAGTMNVKGIKLDGQAENLASDGDAAMTIGKIAATGHLAFNRIVELSKGTEPGGGSNGTPGGAAGGIDSITPQGDGTFVVESTVQMLIFPIPVSTTLRPVLKDGKVRFEVVKANAFIVGIPADYAQGIVDEVTSSAFGKFFDEVTFTDLKVAGDGVDFALHGDNVRFDSTMTNGSSMKAECSLF